jgi:glutamate synthase domain-containing protein 3
MVRLGKIDADAEIEFVKNQIFRHFELTESRLAAQVLLNWEESLAKFVRVIPVDYEKVMLAQNRFLNEGLTTEEAAIEAFMEATV